VYVADLDLLVGKLTESAQRVIDRALEELHRREHALLTTAHVLFAMAQTEWDLFACAMRDVEVNPYDVLRTLDDYLRHLPASGDRDVRVDPALKLVCRLALHHASRMAHDAVQAVDLLVALFEETHGVPASILQQHSAQPSTLVVRLTAQIRERELRKERLKKRFDLPTHLEQFGTNLNRLACLDKLSPIFGRDEEIEQVLEILSHRERSNSVMLVGEPGVGKTAIVEGLARRIELEPDRIPMRLRDAQIVSLQMNALVAGTALRGMFEERLQHIIREVKGRPNLILFVDEAHTMLGAGSAMGAPMDAAEIFKSTLARGEIRMIAATTLSEYKEHLQEDGALARRFRCVQVSEPSIEETRRIPVPLRRMTSLTINRSCRRLRRRPYGAP